MKQLFLISTFVFIACQSFSQNQSHRFGATAGASFQHYNGNLGNSFFKFKSTCFAGVSTTLSMYLNKSFDLTLNNSIGHFGYCPTDEDKARIVAFDQRCPGESCANLVGMGNLRSLLISSTLLIKYKFANDVLIPANSKLVPYVYTGLGINRLSDNMNRNCVNAGKHFSINGGAGLRYDFTDKFNIGYNVDVTCFTSKKVYLTNESTGEAEVHNPDPEAIRMEKRKDLCLKNVLYVGLNF